jgi:hypothetical protein
LRLQGRLQEAIDKFKEAVRIGDVLGGAVGMGKAQEEGVEVSARLDLGLALRVVGRREEAAGVYARLLKVLQVGL